MTVDRAAGRVRYNEVANFSYGPLARGQATCIRPPVEDDAIWWALARYEPVGKDDQDAFSGPAGSLRLYTHDFGKGELWWSTEVFQRGTPNTDVLVRILWALPAPERARLQAALRKFATAITDSRNAARREIERLGVREDGVRALGELVIPDEAPASSVELGLKLHDLSVSEDRGVPIYLWANPELKAAWFAPDPRATHRVVLSCPQWFRLVQEPTEGVILKNVHMSTSNALTAWMALSWAREHPYGVFLVREVQSLAPKEAP